MSRGAAVRVLLGCAALAAFGCRGKSLTDAEMYSICGQAQACTPDLKKQFPTQMDCAADMKKRMPSAGEPCHDEVNAYQRCVLQNAKCTQGVFEAPACESAYQAKLKCNPALDARL